MMTSHATCLRQQNELTMHMTAHDADYTKVNVAGGIVYWAEGASLLQFRVWQAGCQAAQACMHRLYLVLSSGLRLSRVWHTTCAASMRECLQVHHSANRSQSMLQ